MDLKIETLQELLAVDLRPSSIDLGVALSNIHQIHLFYEEHSGMRGDGLIIDGFTVAGLQLLHDLIHNYLLRMRSNED